MTYVLPALTVVLVTAACVSGAVASTAAPAGSDGIQAVYEDDPRAAVGTVVHDGEQYHALWGDKASKQILVRSAASPADLPETDARPLLDPEAVNGTPKFSAVHESGTLHLLVTTHRDGALHYYRGSVDGEVEHVAPVLDVADLPGHDLTHRTAFVRHEGVWFVYVAIRRVEGDRTIAKETHLYTGTSLTELESEGVVLNGSDHESLEMLANVGSVWYDGEAGEFRAYIDGSDLATGEHAYIFRATSSDGRNWSVAADPEIDRADIDAGYNSEHIYAPSGGWVNGTFVALAAGADSRYGFEDYDHDTTLFVTDEFGVSLDDYADAEPDEPPTDTPTPMPTPIETPTPTEEPTPRDTLTPTAAPSGGGGGGGGWTPPDTQTRTVTPQIPKTSTHTAEPTLSPVDPGPTPAPGTPARDVLAWLLELLHEVRA